MELDLGRLRHHQVESSFSDSQSVLAGIRSVQEISRGNPDVCVAVLDGPADLGHPCFRGANLGRHDTLVQDPAGTGPMSVHGTHVTSLIFGQPDSPVLGVAPKCRGLTIPVFRDVQEGHLSQLDLARAIEQAVQEGAHIINVSGGERSPKGQAEGMLARALRLCDDNNVLVVAAAGNDGCDCLHVPAALPSVLAVGAIGANGDPVETSNWGEAYRANGVLAPGEAIRGAVPGGDTASFTGSSFATPIVSGVAALLLSIQRQNGDEIDPRAIGQAILATAVPCHPRDSPECRRYLVGTVNIPGAYAFITRGGKKTVANPDLAQVLSPAAETSVAEVETGALGTSGMGVNAAGDVGPSAEQEASVAQPAGQSAESAPEVPAAQSVRHSPSLTKEHAAATGVVPSADCGCNGGPKSNIFAIGVIGFDFGTEARRDTFRQLMDSVALGDSPPTFVPPNPYDVIQLADYLDKQPWESTKLIWTLNLDLTPIYAVEAELAYAEEVYKGLRSALRNHSLPASDLNFVSRVSVAGVQTNRTTRLFSGQVVPVVVAQPRGLYTWNETALVDAVMKGVQQLHADAAADYVRQTIRNFLDKVYYELRNLGQSPPDRALNFAATNAFIFAEGVRQGLLSARIVPGSANLYTLDTIEVSKSAYCRMDSDCWDVRVTFFDPENDRRAKCVYQYTIDVSDEMPVSLAPTHQFLVSAR